MLECRTVQIGPKIAAIAKLNGFTQAKIAENCGISRVSVNRFFTGKSEIKARELTSMLRMLGLDLEKQVDAKMNQLHLVRDTHAEDAEVDIDVSTVLHNVDKSVKKTLLEQITWWGTSSNKVALQNASQRIRTYIREMSLEPY